MTAYILDSDIDYEHDEHRGRGAFGFDAMGDGRRGADCNSTHVAGTGGGKTCGVATKVSLVRVRVLGCDNGGAYSGIIAGLDWVARNAIQSAVLNGSLGGGFSQTVNDAANNLSRAGVLPVISAGNESKNAENYSPASVERVLTVGAGDRYDDESDFSNFGKVVDLYSPGQDILSAGLGGGSIALNGTSMGTPHVAGAAAPFKQKQPKAESEEISRPRSWTVRVVDLPGSPGESTRAPRPHARSDRAESELSASRSDGVLPGGRIRSSQRRMLLAPRSPRAAARSCFARTPAETEHCCHSQKPSTSLPASDLRSLEPDVHTGGPRAASRGPQQAASWRGTGGHRPVSSAAEHMDDAALAGRLISC
ncbi:S8 family peptidase [Streptomyces sp. NPDC058193]|uniref:S8 family peptidase n=1 Tax=Streptomyces sp. NPDC058193 TaxID=3346373 RepID=UPI0036E0DB2D